MTFLSGEVVTKQCLVLSACEPVGPDEIHPGILRKCSVILFFSSS